MFNADSGGNMNTKNTLVRIVASIVCIFCFIYFREEGRVVFLVFAIWQIEQVLVEANFSSETENASNEPAVIGQKWGK